jgi:hypothetical protein
LFHHSVYLHLPRAQTDIPEQGHHLFFCPNFMFNLKDGRQLIDRSCFVRGAHEDKRIEKELQNRR